MIRWYSHESFGIVSTSLLGNIVHLNQLSDISGALLPVLPLRVLFPSVDVLHNVVRPNRGLNSTHVPSNFGDNPVNFKSFSRLNIRLDIPYLIVFGTMEV